ncbi:MAG: serine hydrolase domain-containing protein [Caldilineaceae bacterium]
MNTQESSTINTELAQIDHWLETEYTTLNLPSLSALIVHGSTPIWMKSWGFADLTQKTPATPDTLYGIRSVTKIFTATMLMQLCERGLLQLDDPIVRYIPEMEVIPQGIQITLRHLVSHTSGLPIAPPCVEKMLPRPVDELTLEDLQQLRYPTIQEVIADLPETQLRFPPGTQLHYSNLGIGLLAHALERIVQQPYEAYVTAQILRPLGMHHAMFDRGQAMGQQLATGYYAWDGKTEQAIPRLPWGAFLAAGGLYASTQDMVHFIAFQLGATQAEHSHILTKQSLEQMRMSIFTTDKPRYVAAGVRGGSATGWFLSSIADFPIVEHGGGDFPYVSFLALVPDLALGVFLATNTGTHTPRIAQMAYQMLNWLVPKFQAQVS